MYTSLGSYPDEHVYRLVPVASRTLGMPDFRVLRGLGRETIPSLASRYLGHFVPHTSTRSFALSVNAVTHPEVRKIYPGATPSSPDWTAARKDRRSYRTSPAWLATSVWRLSPTGRDRTASGDPQVPGLQLRPGLFLHPARPRFCRLAAQPLAGGRKHRDRSGRHCRSKQVSN
ncbi:heme NO-binding domain-containing protein [Pseudomonas sp. Q1-7]|uniref:heme NO-binding domain-containing protein n=1 Tax=Pseudomonas sp. Q1-7 TaxID=3020843 RepID=UPI003FA69ED2